MRAITTLILTLLLQVPDDALPDELCVSDHVQHLFVLSLNERQLELVLGRVDGHRARLALPVEQENLGCDSPIVKHYSLIKNSCFVTCVNSALCS
jgi:hypothetical protein